MLKQKIQFILISLLVASANSLAFADSTPFNSGENGSFLNKEFIEQRIAEVKMELQDIDTLITESSEIIALWKKSSDTLLKHHKRATEQLLSYREIFNSSCNKIKSIIIGKKYKEEFLSQEAQNEYHNCRDKITGYIRVAEKIVAITKDWTYRNERLLERANLKQAVAKANQLIKQALEDELTLLNEMKKDLYILDEVKNTLQRLEE